MRVSNEALRGRVVIGADGQAIGDIEAMTIDTSTWTVDTLVVKLRRGIGDQIGAKHTWFRSPSVEIPIRSVQSVGDTVVLSMSVGELRDLSGAGAHASSHPEQPEPAR